MKQVDEYIAGFPVEVQTRLHSIRALILATVPDAEERFSYGMPAYKFRGKPLVYFAGFTKHIGLYALPTTHAAFATSLKPYKQGKGSVQFPFSTPLPLDLIRHMIEHRVALLVNV